MQQYKHFVASYTAWYVTPLAGAVRAWMINAAACNAGLNPGVRVTQSCGPLIGTY